ncbi:MAG: hypothetical protein WCO98_08070, partial [bacterium]
MSHSTIFIASPPMQALLPAVSATGMLATGAGIAAVSVAVYLAVKDLKREHEASMAIFNQRCADHEAHIIAKNAAYSAQLASALELAEVTYQVSTQNALADFIVHKLHNCIQRMTIAPNAPEDLITRLNILQNEFNENGESEEIAERIYQLSNDIFESTELSVHTISAEKVLEEIENVKQEIILLPAELQAKMLESVEQYEKMAVKQSKMAMQGVKLLKDRIYREITLIKQREKEREESRKLINESLACINAMQKQNLETYYQDAAAEFLNELQALIQKSSGIQAIREMYQRINTTYNECETVLQKLSDNEMVKMKLIETLLSMGMKVQVKEDGEEGIIAVIDSTVGMDFSIQNGEVKAELVAVNEEKTAMPDEIEGGCQLTDTVMEHLAENGMEVREKFRKSHKYADGHKLRVVKVKIGGDEISAFAE